MPWSTSSSTAAANISLTTLASEAQSLYEQARRYREEMEKLPAGDPRREVYEKTILDLLERARKMSETLTTTATNS